MSYLTLRAYLHYNLSHIPWSHLVMMGVLALALTGFLMIRKKEAVYGAIMLGLTVFVGLLLLDVAVAIRYLGVVHHASGIDLKVDLDRLFHPIGQSQAEILSNIAIFVPFGFFLSEFLASTRRFSAWRRIGFVVLCSFGLSLCIECLQLILLVGFFELTDLVMNTAGAFVGAVLCVVVSRRRWHEEVA